MAIVLFALCLIAFLAGGLTLYMAQSAIHEIESFIWFLISAVLLTGAAVVDAVKNARNTAATQSRSTDQPPAQERVPGPIRMPPQPQPIQRPLTPEEVASRQRAERVIITVVAVSISIAIAIGGVYWYATRPPPVPMMTQPPVAD